MGQSDPRNSYDKTFPFFETKGMHGYLPTDTKNLF